ncbi:NAD-dependent epimerase/dehydratase family protein [Catenovulum sediminis]|uniref:NAD-dependent epimerase/dehydratase family protein n=1 Tax=Catenovulum sediminis TaxID=1740262 RepID=A0ABV1RJV3_9ALTE
MFKPSKVLVTGSSGFVGGCLVGQLEEQYSVMKVVRNQVAGGDSNVIALGNITGKTDFSSALNGVDVVVHLAARAHITKDTVIDPLNEFRKCNTEATLKLAKQASEAGVKRFIFISSIGVNGLSNDKPFTAFDDPNPTEDYAISKYEAECGLKEIAKYSQMEWVIIRPPLVYGKNAPGNFGTLIKVARKNLPLPLGAINNSRSFVYVENLVDLVMSCIVNRKAAGRTFLVSDGENISTTQLLNKLIEATGRKSKLIPIPVSILKFFAGLIGKKMVVERFSSSLTVDIEHTKSTLGWKPPVSLDEGIRRCFK